MKPKRTCSMHGPIHKGTEGTGLRYKKMHSEFQKSRILLISGPFTNSLSLNSIFHSTCLPKGTNFVDQWTTYKFTFIELHFSLTRRPLCWGNQAFLGRLTTTFPKMSRKGNCLHSTFHTGASTLAQRQKVWLFSVSNFAKE